MRSLIGVAFLALLASAVASRPASAHALGAECKLRGEQVELEAYFDDDTPARDAKVRVFDADKKLLVEGRTDAQGRWSFPIPQPGRYPVIVDAGAGHITRLSIVVPARDTPPAAAATVSLGDGPSRQEFTRFPWLKVGLGLSIIATAALLTWTVRCGLRAWRPHAEAATLDSHPEQRRSS